MSEGTLPYSSDTSHPSVPSILVVGINDKLPNFNTTAITLNIDNISSELRPRISNDFCLIQGKKTLIASYIANTWQVRERTLVKVKFVLSSSVAIVSCNNSYLSKFLSNFNDSVVIKRIC